MQQLVHFPSTLRNPCLLFSSIIGYIYIYCNSEESSAAFVGFFWRFPFFGGRGGGRGGKEGE